MIKAIKAYETEDGAVFLTKEEAIQHEAKFEFLDWYDENTIPGRCAGGDPHGSDFIDWLKMHHKKVSEFIKTLEELS